MRGGVPEVRIEHIEPVLLLLNWPPFRPDLIYLTEHDARLSSPMSKHGRTMWRML